jgi:hypothetical protein
LLLLILFIFFIEHKVKCRKYDTVAVTVDHRAHGCVASEGTKNDRRTAR